MRRPNLSLPSLTWPDIIQPDLTWPYLTLSDLTWPDLTWPDLNWPDLAGSDLTWPDITWILTRNVSKKSERYVIKNWRYEEVRQLTDWQTYKKFRIIWNKWANIQGMPLKNFRKISHPEQEIYLYWPNFSEEVSQLTDWQTNKKFVIIWKKCANISKMSQKNFRKISQSEQKICLHSSNIYKEISQLTDWQTYKQFAFIWK